MSLLGKGILHLREERSGSGAVMNKERPSASGGTIPTRGSDKRGSQILKVLITDFDYGEVDIEHHILEGDGLFVLYARPVLLRSRRRRACLADRVAAYDAQPVIEQTDVDGLPLVGWCPAIPGVVRANSSSWLAESCIRRGPHSALSS